MDRLIVFDLKDKLFADLNLFFLPQHLLSVTEHEYSINGIFLPFFWDELLDLIKSFFYPIYPSRVNMVCEYLNFALFKFHS